MYTMKTEPNAEPLDLQPLQPLEIVKHILKIYLKVDINQNVTFKDLIPLTPYITNPEAIRLVWLNVIATGKPINATVIREQEQLLRPFLEDLIDVCG